MRITWIIVGGMERGDPRPLGGGLLVRLWAKGGGFRAPDLPRSTRGFGISIDVCLIKYLPYRKMQLSLTDRDCVRVGNMCDFIAAEMMEVRALSSFSS